MRKFLIFIKSVLIKTAGVKGYLRVISSTYFLLDRVGMLKYFGQELHDIFHLNKFVKKGNICIDIGANLGYYTVPLSKLSGKSGKVYSVEPVPVFVETLRHNLSKTKADNVVILNCALGENDGEIITMGTPIVDGIFRHGYTKVVENDGFEYADKYDVKIRNPHFIFDKLDRIDFIKCDVEGYENHIIPLIYDLIQKHKPVMLIEFGSSQNKKIITDQLVKFDYEVYSVSKSNLSKVANPGISDSETFNFFFIPSDKITFAR